MPRTATVSAERVYRNPDGSLTTVPASKQTLALAAGKEIPDALLPYYDSRGKLKEATVPENKEADAGENKTGLTIVTSGGRRSSSEQPKERRR